MAEINSLAVGDSTETTEYLVFQLGKEEFGIDILHVQEIRGYDKVTQIANTPAFIKGVINLRGQIVPIIDMRIRFNREDVTYDQFTVVIVINVLGRIVGLVVDAVSDVIELLSSEIAPPPSFSAALKADYLVGLGTKDDRMIMITDIERLLCGQELLLFDQTIAHDEQL